MRLKGLQDLYDVDSPVATVYFESDVPTEDAGDKTELRVRALTEALDGLGAPERLRRRVEQVLTDTRPGEQQRDGRVAVIGESGALLDETYVGSDAGDRAYWGAPVLGAFLRERTRAVGLLTVVADAQGAVLQDCSVVEAAGSAVEPGEAEQVSGTSELPVHKPRGKALAHARIQRRVDEAVRHNAKDVVDRIAGRVSKTRPAAVVLAGEVSARTAISQHLNTSVTPLVEVDGDLDQQALTAVAADLVDRREAALSERWHEALAHQLAVQGRDEVMRAAQIGAVETLLVGDADLPEAREGEGALTDEDALVRACAYTDSAIERLPAGLPVTDGFGALLRYPLPAQ